MEVHKTEKGDSKSKTKNQIGHSEIKPNNLKSKVFEGKLRRNGENK